MQAFKGRSSAPFVFALLVVSSEMSSDQLFDFMSFQASTEKLCGLFVLENPNLYWTSGTKHSAYSGEFGQLNLSSLRTQGSSNRKKKNWNRDAEGYWIPDLRFAPSGMTNPTGLLKRRVRVKKTYNVKPPSQNYLALQFIQS
jgi:hypothetical protein